MVKTKPYHSPEGNEPKKLTGESKGQSPNPNKYKVKETWTKIQGPEFEDETNFKCRCSDLEGYISNLGPQASENIHSRK